MLPHDVDMITVTRLLLDPALMRTHGVAVGSSPHGMDTLTSHGFWLLKDHDGSTKLSRSSTSLLPIPFYSRSGPMDSAMTSNIFNTSSAVLKTGANGVWLTTVAAAAEGGR